jgi:hypothetical protein
LHLGLHRVHDKLLALGAVSERGGAAHPEALLLGCGDLVPDALARDLALEVGEGEKDVERRSKWAKERRTLSVSRPFRAGGAG